MTLLRVDSAERRPAPRVERIVDAPVPRTPQTRGSPSRERAFRPDVQGLRALAILLVVAFHAGLPIHGGYVGVDVFFVISGFVITGVLLRERESRASTSILSFYARRVRRILPAASLVIVVVVLASTAVLGGVLAQATAADARWATMFLANFHFAATGTNYLASQRPPSPLQNYWSLAVEEQFYLVYPALFAIVAWLSRRGSLRRHLAMLLTIVIVASFVFSITATSSAPTAAYFSPLTRAWELALGALVALSTGFLRRIPTRLAAVASWSGLGAIIVSAISFGSGTAYPGAAVALPVVGTAMVIAAGAASPSWGAESVLRRRPVQWLALISYSLYLWHWPILTVVAERDNKTSLPVAEGVVLVLVSVALAAATYRLVENPVRNATPLKLRRWATVGLGAVILSTCFAVSSALVGSGGVESNQLAAAGLHNVCPTPSSALVAALRTRSGVAAEAPTTAPVRALVVGDSTACTMLPGLEAVGAAFGIEISNAAITGCGVVSGSISARAVDGLNEHAFTRKCSAEARSVEGAALLREHPKLVLWSSTWERTPITGPDGRTLVVGTRPWTVALLDRVDRRVFQFASAGARTVFLLQPPPFSAGAPSRSDAQEHAFLAMNSVLKSYALRHPQTAAVVDLGRVVCPTGTPCPYVVGGVVMRPDGFHYSTKSAVDVARWLMPQLAVMTGDVRTGESG